MPYKLLAIDIDGTVLNDESRITPRTHAAIVRAMTQGVRVTLCTGRGLVTSARVVRQLPLNAPLILNGGALIYDTHRRRALYLRNLASQIAQETVRRLRALPLHPIVYAPLPDSPYFYYDASDPDNRAFQTYVDKNPGRAHRVDDVLAAMWDRPAMVAAIDRLERMRALKPEIETALPETTATLEISPDNQAYCHITLTPAGVSKGSGLCELALLLGIDLADTIAIGDNLNDLDMIECAGLGVAMGNAPSETRARADHITGSNNEDGVAQVIERFILNRM